MLRWQIQINLVYFQPSPCLWAAFGMAPDLCIHLCTPEPWELAFGFYRGSRFRYLSVEAIGRKLTGLIQFIWKNLLLASASLPLFFIPEDAHQGSCLITGGSIWPALSFCLLVQFSHPCHLQDSRKIVRGMPVGGTCCFFLHCFSLNFYIRAWVHCSICMVSRWYIIKK